MSSNSKMDQRIAKLEFEIRRLRDGLQWYASGKHYSFDPDWEEEEGWLCPPSSDSFMVEPGHVANAVLDGGAMNPDDESDSAVIMPIKNDEQHTIALSRCEDLIGLDPQASSAEGKELMILSEFVERYEKSRWPINRPSRGGLA